jgi:hypothetical protein
MQPNPLSGLKSGNPGEDLVKGILQKLLQGKMESGHTNGSVNVTLLNRLAVDMAELASLDCPEDPALAALGLIFKGFRDLKRQISDKGNGASQA